MLETIDVGVIRISLPLIEAGVAKYIDIMNTLHTCNVSHNADFQKAYIGFYKMRQRKPDYYQLYFSFMEKQKRFSLEFETILDYLYKLHHE